MSYQREFDKVLRIGMVGVGAHCYRNIFPTLTHLPVKLVALCDLNADLLRKTGEQYGVSQLYSSAKEMYQNEQLDAVIICVSPFAHPTLACEALDAGLHVWMEKPPASRASEVDAMIKARRDKVVVVGFKKQFMPGIRKIEEILRQPESGPLVHMLAEYDVGLPENGDRSLEEKKVTNWLANGVHPLSAMLQIGGPAASVTARRGTRGGGACQIEFRNGAFGNLHFAEGMKGPTERYSFYTGNTQVVLENGLRLTWHRGAPNNNNYSDTFAPEGLTHGSVVWEVQNTWASFNAKALATQGFYAELHHFCDCILSGRAPTLGTLEFAKHLMLVYEAALVSAGEPLDIAE